jgi:hypothetical protein
LVELSVWGGGVGSSNLSARIISILNIVKLEKFFLRYIDFYFVMTYSKIHQAFSNYLEQPDALTNPANYLGPNWEDVLNFWIYLDTLSDREKKEIGQRYWDLDNIVRLSAFDTARNAAEEVVGEEFSDAAWDAADVVTGWWVFCYATWELIGHHKLLEQGKTPTFLPLCLNHDLL